MKNDIIINRDTRNLYASVSSSADAFSFFLACHHHAILFFSKKSTFETNLFRGQTQLKYITFKFSAAAL